VDLEIAIINLISQIPMSIWLYNDGRTIVASTLPPSRRGCRQLRCCKDTQAPKEKDEASARGGGGVGMDEEGRSQQQAKHMDIFMSIIF